MYADALCTVKIWNENAYDPTYVKILRSALDSAGFPNTQLVVADNNWAPADEVNTDPEFAACVYAIGFAVATLLSSGSFAILLLFFYYCI